MCTVLLPTGVKPIAVKCIIYIISYHVRTCGTYICLWDLKYQYKTEGKNARKFQWKVGGKKKLFSLQSRKQHPTALSVCELVSACNV